MASPDLLDIFNSGDPSTNATEDTDASTAGSQTDGEILLAFQSDASGSGDQHNSTNAGVNTTEDLKQPAETGHLSDLLSLDVGNNLSPSDSVATDHQSMIISTFGQQISDNKASENQTSATCETEIELKTKPAGDDIAGIFDSASKVNTDNSNSSNVDLLGGFFEPDSCTTQDDDSSFGHPFLTQVEKQENVSAGSLLDLSTLSPEAFQTGSTSAQPLNELVLTPTDQTKTAVESSNTSLDATAQVEKHENGSSGSLLDFSILSPEAVPTGSSTEAPVNELMSTLTDQTETAVQSGNKGMDAIANILDSSQATQSQPEQQTPILSLDISGISDDVPSGVSMKSANQEELTSSATTNLSDAASPAYNGSWNTLENPPDVENDANTTAVLGDIFGDPSIPQAIGIGSSTTMKQPVSVLDDLSGLSEQPAMLQIKPESASSKVSTDGLIDVSESQPGSDDENHSLGFEPPFNEADTTPLNALEQDNTQLVEDLATLQVPPVHNPDTELKDHSSSEQVDLFGIITSPNSTGQNSLLTQSEHQQGAAKNLDLNVASNDGFKLTADHNSDHGQTTEILTTENGSTDILSLQPGSGKENHPLGFETSFAEADSKPANDLEQNNTWLAEDVVTPQSLLTHNPDAELKDHAASDQVDLLEIFTSNMLTDEKSQVTEIEFQQSASENFDLIAISGDDFKLTADHNSDHGQTVETLTTESSQLDVADKSEASALGHDSQFDCNKDVPPAITQTSVRTGTDTPESPLSGHAADGQYVDNLTPENRELTACVDDDFELITDTEIIAARETDTDNSNISLAVSFKETDVGVNKFVQIEGVEQKPMTDESDEHFDMFKTKNMDQPEVSRVLTNSASSQSSDVQSVSAADGKSILPVNENGAQFISVDTEDQPSSTEPDGAQKTALQISEPGWSSTQSILEEQPGNQPNSGISKQENVTDMFDFQSSQDQEMNIIPQEIGKNVYEEASHILDLIATEDFQNNEKDPSHEKSVERVPIDQDFTIINDSESHRAKDETNTAEVDISSSIQNANELLDQISTIQNDGKTEVGKMNDTFTAADLFGPSTLGNSSAVTPPEKTQGTTTSSFQEAGNVATPEQGLSSQEIVLDTFSQIDDPEVGLPVNEASLMGNETNEQSRSLIGITGNVLAPMLLEKAEDTCTSDYQGEQEVGLSNEPMGIVTVISSSTEKEQPLVNTPTLGDENEKEQEIEQSSYAGKDTLQQPSSGTNRVQDTHNGVSDNDEALQSTVSELLDSVYESAAKDLNLYDGKGELVICEQDHGVKANISDGESFSIVTPKGEIAPGSEEGVCGNSGEPVKQTDTNADTTVTQASPFGISESPNLVKHAESSAPDLDQVIDPIITSNRPEYTLSGASLVHDDTLVTTIATEPKQDKRGDNSDHMILLETDAGTRDSAESNSTLLLSGMLDESEKTPIAISDKPTMSDVTPTDQAQESYDSKQRTVDDTKSESSDFLMPLGHNMEKSDGDRSHDVLSDSEICETATQSVSESSPSLENESVCGPNKDMNGLEIPVFGQSKPSEQMLAIKEMLIPESGDRAAGETVQQPCPGSDNFPATNARKLADHIQSSGLTQQDDDFELITETEISAATENIAPVAPSGKSPNRSPDIDQQDLSFTSDHGLTSDEGAESFETLSTTQFGVNHGQADIESPEENSADIEGKFPTSEGETPSAVVGKLLPSTETFDQNALFISGDISDIPEPTQANAECKSDPKPAPEEGMAEEQGSTSAEGTESFETPSTTQFGIEHGQANIELHTKDSAESADEGKSPSSEGKTLSTVIGQPLPSIETSDQNALVVFGDLTDVSEPTQANAESKTDAKPAPEEGIAIEQGSNSAEGTESFETLNITQCDMKHGQANIELHTKDSAESADEGKSPSSESDTPSTAIGQLLPSIETSDQNASVACGDLSDISKPTQANAENKADPKLIPEKDMAAEQGSTSDEETDSFETLGTEQFGVVHGQEDIELPEKDVSRSMDASASPSSDDETPSAVVGQLMPSTDTLDQNALFVSGDPSEPTQANAESKADVKPIPEAIITAEQGSTSAERTESFKTLSTTQFGVNHGQADIELSEKDSAENTDEGQFPSSEGETLSAVVDQQFLPTETIDQNVLFASGDLTEVSEPTQANTESNAKPMPEEVMTAELRSTPAGGTESFETPGTEQFGVIRGQADIELPEKDSSSSMDESTPQSSDRETPSPVGGQLLPSTETFDQSALVVSGDHTDIAVLTQENADAKPVPEDTLASATAAQFVVDASLFSAKQDATETFPNDQLEMDSKSLLDEMSAVNQELGSYESDIQTIETASRGSHGTAVISSSHHSNAEDIFDTSLFCTVQEPLEETDGQSKASEMLSDQISAESIANANSTPEEDLTFPATTGREYPLRTSEPQAKSSTLDLDEAVEKSATNQSSDASLSDSLDGDFDENNNLTDAADGILTHDLVAEYVDFVISEAVSFVSCDDTMSEQSPEQISREPKSDAAVSLLVVDAMGIHSSNIDPHRGEMENLAEHASLFETNVTGIAQEDPKPETDSEDEEGPVPKPEAALQSAESNTEHKEFEQKVEAHPIVHTDVDSNVMPVEDASPPQIPRRKKKQKKTDHQKYDSDPIEIDKDSNVSERQKTENVYDANGPAEMTGHVMARDSDLSGGIETNVLSTKAEPEVIMEDTASDFASHESQEKPLGDATSQIPNVIVTEEKEDTFQNFEPKVSSTDQAAIYSNLVNYSCPDTSRTDPNSQEDYHLSLMPDKQELSEAEDKDKESILPILQNENDTNSASESDFAMSNSDKMSEKSSHVEASKSVNPSTITGTETVEKSPTGLLKDVLKQENAKEETVPVANDTSSFLDFDVLQNKPTETRHELSWSDFPGEESDINLDVFDIPSLSDEGQSDDTRAESEKFEYLPGYEVKNATNISGFTNEDLLVGDNVSLLTDNQNKSSDNKSDVTLKIHPDSLKESDDTDSFINNGKTEVTMSSVDDQSNYSQVPDRYRYDVTKQVDNDNEEQNAGRGEIEANEDLNGATQAMQASVKASGEEDLLQILTDPRDTKNDEEFSEQKFDREEPEIVAAELNVFQIQSSVSFNVTSPPSMEFDDDELYPIAGSFEAQKSSIAKGVIKKVSSSNVETYTATSRSYVPGRSYSSTVPSSVFIDQDVLSDNESGDGSTHGNDVSSSEDEKEEIPAQESTFQDEEEYDTRYLQYQPGVTAHVFPVVSSPNEQSGTDPVNFTYQAYDSDWEELVMQAPPRFPNLPVIMEETEPSDAEESPAPDMTVYTHYETEEDFAGEDVKYHQQDLVDGPQVDTAYASLISEPGKLDESDEMHAMDNKLIPKIVISPEEIDNSIEENETDKTPYSSSGEKSLETANLEEEGGLPAELVNQTLLKQIIPTIVISSDEESSEENETDEIEHHVSDQAFNLEEKTVSTVPDKDPADLLEGLSTEIARGIVEEAIASSSVAQKEESDSSSGSDENAEHSYVLEEGKEHGGQTVSVSEVKDQILVTDGKLQDGDITDDISPVENPLQEVGEHSVRNTDIGIENQLLEQILDSSIAPASAENPVSSEDSSFEHIEVDSPADDDLLKSLESGVSHADSVDASSGTRDESFENVKVVAEVAENPFKELALSEGQRDDDVIALELQDQSPATETSLLTSIVHNKDSTPTSPTISEPNFANIQTTDEFSVPEDSPDLHLPLSETNNLVPYTNEDAVNTKDNTLSDYFSVIETGKAGEMVVSSSVRQKDEVEWEEKPASLSEVETSGQQQLTSGEIPMVKDTALDIPPPPPLRKKLRTEDVVTTEQKQEDAAVTPPPPPARKKKALKVQKDIENVPMVPESQMQTLPVIADKEVVKESDTDTAALNRDLTSSPMPLLLTEGQKHVAEVENVAEKVDTRMIEASVQEPSKVELSYTQEREIPVVIDKKDSKLITPDLPSQDNQFFDPAVSSEVTTPADKSDEITTVKDWQVVQEGNAHTYPNEFGDLDSIKMKHSSDQMPEGPPSIAKPEVVSLTLDDSVANEQTCNLNPQPFSDNRNETGLDAPGAMEIGTCVFTAGSEMIHTKDQSDESESDNLSSLVSESQSGETDLNQALMMGGMAASKMSSEIHNKESEDGDSDGALEISFSEESDDDSVAESSDEETLHENLLESYNSMAEAVVSHLMQEVVNLEEKQKSEVERLRNNEVCDELVSEILNQVCSDAENREKLHEPEHEKMVLESTTDSIGSRTENSRMSQNDEEIGFPLVRIPGDGSEEIPQVLETPGDKKDTEVLEVAPTPYKMPLKDEDDSSGLVAPRRNKRTRYDTTGSIGSIRYLTDSEDEEDNEKPQEFVHSQRPEQLIFLDDDAVVDDEETPSSLRSPELDFSALDDDHPHPKKSLHVPSSLVLSVALDDIDLTEKENATESSIAVTPVSARLSFSSSVTGSQTSLASSTEDTTGNKRSRLPKLPSLRSKKASSPTEPSIVKTKLELVPTENIIPIVAKPEGRRFVRWESVTIKNIEYRIDESAIQPYKKVVAHGGFYDEKSAIIEIFTSYLPHTNTEHYAWVMDNLFLYVLATVELLALDKFSVVMFIGSTPKSQIPANSLLKKWHEHVDYRLKKYVEAFYIVNPTLYFRTMARLFVSRKVMKKMKYVKSMAELKTFIPTDFLFVPPEIAK